MLKPIRSRLAVGLAVVALGSASAAAQDYMGRGYYGPPPAYGYAPPPSSGFGPPSDYNYARPYWNTPPTAYGYAPPPAAYGYVPPPGPAYGYAPPVAPNYYAPPVVYGYPAYRYDATPPYNPYYFGTEAWWNERDREGVN